MDYDTLMMQRAGAEPTSGNSPLPSPRQPQVCEGPGPDSLSLSVSHLGEHEAVLIETQLPFDEVTLDEDMAASASWAVRHRESLRAQRRVPGQILAEMTEWLRPLQHPLRRGTSPPAQARGHHVVMNRHHHVLQRVAGQPDASKAPADPRPGEHHRSDMGLGGCQEKTATDDFLEG